MNVTMKTFARQLTDAAIVQKIPIFGTFELTTRCNLNCKMCFICNNEQSRRDELSTAQWLDIARQAQQAGMFFLVLTGGEAMIRDDFKELYLGLQKLGLLITINSNATTITPDMADFLAANPPRMINISLYGSSPEAYQKVTGSAAAYDKVMNAIRLLDERGLYYRLRSILIRDTADDLLNIFDFIMSKGQTGGLVNYITPPMEGCGNDPMGSRLSARDVVDMERRLSDHMTAWAKEHPDVVEQARKNRGDQPELTELSEFHELAKAERSKTAYRCSSSKIAFWVSYHGLMVPCALLREPRVSLLETPFSEAWSLLRGACAEIPTCPECDGCALKSRCGVCPPRLKLETGSFSEKAPYLCELAKASVSVRE